MKNRSWVMVLTVLIAFSAFFVAIWLYQRQTGNRPAVVPNAQAAALIRMHAPYFGDPRAPVTIVEFFDPSCEACRAFFPYVKAILNDYPKDVRLVIRYAAFHPGSDEAVLLLELARKQGSFVPVLEALLARQSEWAKHGAPDLRLARAIASAAGLRVDQGEIDAISQMVRGILKQDGEDGEVLGVHKTPTFFVNGRPLASIGPKALRELVEAELAAAQGRR
jgi:protein-disulfide isomerase